MKTLLLGDSLTAWHDWSGILGAHLNHGLPGDTTEGLLRRLPGALTARPERVILTIGTNDLLQQIPLETLKENYLDILNELLEIEQLIVHSLPPVADAPGINEQIIAFNHWLMEQTWKYHFHFVDLYHALAGRDNALKPEYTTDGVHLSGAGYAAWEALMMTALEEA